MKFYIRFAIWVALLTYYFVRGSFKSFGKRRNKRMVCVDVDNTYNNVCFKIDYC